MNGIYRKPNECFDTGDFELAHGHKPRGKGTWGFRFHYCEGATVVFWSPANDYYSEAKACVIRQSRARFGRRAWSVIGVLP